MKYRPEGFKNPYTIRISTGFGDAWADVLQDLRLSIFEAGADAMLDALRAQAIPGEEVSQPGVVVFIPDD